MEAVPVELSRRDYRVLVATTPDEALAWIEQEPRIDGAIIDLQLPIQNSQRITAQESHGGNRAGLVLAAEFRKRWRRAPIVLWTFTPEREIRESVVKLGRTWVLPKSNFNLVADLLDDALRGFRSGTRPKIFVVHGHDERTRHAVCEYFVTKLGFPPPIVLRDQPSMGRSIMEKLEASAQDVDLVVVLLTPDDQVISSGNGDALYRSRQNVIFELGYFVGVLGRHSGRVLLLYRKPIELPSDLAGIVPINITHGLEDADAAIRRELAEWL